MPHDWNGIELHAGDRVRLGTKEGTVLQLMPECQCEVRFDGIPDYDENHLVAATRLFKKVVNE